jgi:hypothetical protein
MKLKLNISSYCSLLWSLIGDHCNYYKDLLKLNCILDREGVLHHLGGIHKRDVRVNHVGDHGRLAGVFWMKSCGVGFCAGGTILFRFFFP